MSSLTLCNNVPSCWHILWPITLCCFSSKGLKVPPTCELVVGGEPQCWSEGSCLLFDDSFLHRAFHEGEVCGRAGDRGQSLCFVLSL